MFAALLIPTVVVALVLAWKFSPKQVYTPDPDDPLDDGSSGPIDRAALERAEREVRGMGSPEEERPQDDWGPGTKQVDD